ncbi:hypothetical protein JIG36_21130 [Actinoplanes sp. LDG1-06]|uniref:Uncharacterized protein n=2 Tax=Paractinoplanes ovalisporus TaxID=2810368 RepID=A0ABS2AE18_9ACTN|nr:hypothetical protein [Actinoplanes ovalisporus]
MVVLTAALVPLLPYAVVVVRRREELRRKRAWTPLDQACHEVDPAAVVARLGPPPIEWLAHDLRRLERQRRGGVTLESDRWFEAVMRAYDDRLCMACECLGVEQNLRPLHGIDREIERVRVVGALEAAGLDLR